jgi:hypothetical protein
MDELFASWTYEVISSNLQAKDKIQKIQTCPFEFLRVILEMQH